MTKTEREHIVRVAKLGCIACRKLGHFTPEVEIHKTEGGNYFAVIPLCKPHGSGYRDSEKAWESQFGKKAEMLAEVRRALEVAA